MAGCAANTIPARGIRPPSVCGFEHPAALSKGAELKTTYRRPPWPKSTPSARRVAPSGIFVPPNPISNNCPRRCAGRCPVNHRVKRRSS
ncbi:hypothetical protein D1345_09095 [Chromobacterium rhizoryzae]|uniref:Uncharacterized protein n=1 Tax=Chromobacterium rhizoryzae TaxID=1778675 RepID=A0AAD0W8G2_9NEIS|nr:hypothetical protein D1345_09095 [Chromobacterium rhizoryzae]